MTARVLAPDELDAAASLLADGAVIAVPTDTVYGLAVALSGPAPPVALFEAKGRPEGLPVAVLCADAAAARALVGDWPAPAERLAQRYWPGPLTVVVRAEEALCARVGATLGVGLRVPDDELCRSLLRVTGPLAVTSANLHGDPPATTASAVLEAFADVAVVAVLDAGRRDGAVSTVVDLTGDVPLVVRAGAIAAHDVLLVASG